MPKLTLPAFGIELSWSGDDRGGAAITSDMYEEGAGCNEFNAAVDGIESLILAHFCAGIDVASPAYLEGIETAYAAIGNNL